MGCCFSSKAVFRRICFARRLASVRAQIGRPDTLSEAE
jgi:hypothetical protein